LEGGLELVATNRLKCPYRWEFAFEFQCANVPYGDRIEQYVMEGVAAHTAEIIIEQGKVVSAICLITSLR
jgi:hypothetical protein